MQLPTKSSLTLWISQHQVSKVMSQPIHFFVYAVLTKKITAHSKWVQPYRMIHTYQQKVHHINWRSNGNDYFHNCFLRICSVYDSQGISTSSILPLLPLPAWWFMSVRMSAGTVLLLTTVTRMTWSHGPRSSRLDVLTTPPLSSSKRQNVQDVGDTFHPQVIVRARHALTPL